MDTTPIIDEDQSSDTDAYHSDGPDNDDAKVTEKVIQVKGKDEYTAVYISGAFIGAKLYEYRKRVAVTVYDSHFFGSVEFRFHDHATIKFEGNHCHGSAFFEAHGTLVAKFSECRFSGTKTIIFHENSKLDCRENKFYGSLLYKGHAELDVKFHECGYYGTVDISAEKLIANRESGGAQNRFQKVISYLKKDRFCFWFLMLCLFMVQCVMLFHCLSSVRIADSMNSTKIDEMEIFKPVDINVDAVYCDRTYTYDEKVNVTVRGTTYMYSIGFKFKKDAHLTFIGVTCKSEIQIEGNALLHTTFLDSSFHGEKEIIFHGDGSVNCNRSTYLARTTFNHHGKLQQNTTNCVYVRSHYRT